MVSGLHPVSAAVVPFAERAPSSGPRLATGVLDLLRDAVLVVGRDARPLFINRAAHMLLREGDGLMLSPRGGFQQGGKALAHHTPTEAARPPGAAS